MVGDYQGTGQFGGYYVQEEDVDVDADPNTSEGVFVFNTTPRTWLWATWSASVGRAGEFGRPDPGRRT